MGLRRHAMMVHDLGSRHTWHLKQDVVPAVKALFDRFEPARCSWWTYHSDSVGRAILLGGFPYVQMDGRADGFSKVPGILRYVGDRPFVWLDDDVTDHELEVLDAEHGDHLVVRVDPATGLTTESLTLVEAWVAARQGTPGDVDAEPEEP